MGSWRSFVLVMGMVAAAGGCESEPSPAPAPHDAGIPIGGGGADTGGDTEANAGEGGDEGGDGVDAGDGADAGDGLDGGDGADAGDGLDGGDGGDAGPCAAQPAGMPCPDVDPCDGDEICDGQGSCAPGAPPDLDDGNPCTLDACEPALGVTHTPAPAGTPCADADPCDGEEACDGASACALGVPPAIDDGDPCTFDTCDPAAGITHAACSALDPTVTTTIAHASGFLTAGQNPVQSGVAPGTIDVRRAAVIRGQVRGPGGSPLAGVVVEIQAHPEYGSTRTFADGMFAMPSTAAGRSWSATTATATCRSHGRWRCRGRTTRAPRMW